MSLCIWTAWGSWDRRPADFRGLAGAAGTGDPLTWGGQQGQLRPESRWLEGASKGSCRDKSPADLRGPAGAAGTGVLLTSGGQQGQLQGPESCWLEGASRGSWDRVPLTSGGQQQQLGPESRWLQGARPAGAAGTGVPLTSGDQHKSAREKSTPSALLYTNKIGIADPVRFITRILTWKVLNQWLFFLKGMHIYIYIYIYEKHCVYY